MQQLRENQDFVHLDTLELVQRSDTGIEERGVLQQTLGRHDGVRACRLEKPFRVRPRLHAPVGHDGNRHHLLHSTDDLPVGSPLRGFRLARGAAVN